MKLTSRNTTLSIALFACLAACTANVSSVPVVVDTGDAGPTKGGSDSGSPSDTDSATPTPTPGPDGAAPVQLDPALIGTWRTNDTLDNMKDGYASFALDATFDAQGTLALATNATYDASSLKPGCTEKYTASGTYSVKGATLVSSGAGTNGDTFGKVSRTGCTNASDNVTDGTMTDNTRGRLFNSLAGPYAVSGNSFTVKTSTGVVLTFTKQ